MADKVLIDQCFMWCLHSGLEPIKIGNPSSLDEALMVSAIADFEGEFKDLNERQRRLIAGCVY